MIGTKLGIYEITGKLGQGGMGEVYRAKDTHLGRDVALKVLPEGFTADPERLARFEREAKVLAQLNHPNIAQIYGFEKSGDSRALVMELVEGPTLAERMEAGRIPWLDCVATAVQIADALEAAHEKGIVHRDLKPQNVKAPIDGKVKVLDFGLAKAMDSTAGAGTGSASQLAQSPTMTMGATQLGVILGTAAYMAPEQAAGGAVDRRADIWAFGVVLYEMLTGRRLFEGETVSHVLASVLKDAPDFAALPAETPARIRDLLRRCLRKRPRERLQAIGDARLVLEEVLADPDAEELATAPIPTAAFAPRRRRARLPWLLAAAGVAAAVAFAALWMLDRGAAAPRPALLAALVAPPDTGFGDTFTLSPDGRRIVFHAFDRKTRVGSLWLRDLDRGQAVPLASTEGGQMAFWSPDGSQLAFFAEGKLKRLDPRGGPAQTICDAPSPRGGTWGPDGRIVFASAFRIGLSIVPAGGGAARPLTELDPERREKSHRFPVFLPGGASILFLAQSAEAGALDDQSAIEALDLATGKRTRLIGANSSPLFASGQILYGQEGALLAQPFDAARLALTGDPVVLASPVAFTQNEQALATVSNEGTLVYREGERGTFSSIGWLDRSGIGVRLPLDQGLFRDFALTADGERLVYTNNSSGKGDMDLWIRAAESAASSRLTFEEGGDYYPVWSPDGRFVYYTNDRRNDGVIFRRASDGGGPAEEIGTTASGIWSLGISADGSWLVVGGVTDNSGLDLFRFDLATKQLTPLVQTPWVDQEPALSPDDRLLAYASEQSGRWEVYVQALAGATGRWQISTEGGQRPRWRGDGRELFYLVAPDRVMSVAVEPGPVPRFGPAREVFRQAIIGFDVSGDGQSFVVLRPSDSDLHRPLTLLSNWTAKLGQP